MLFIWVEINIEIDRDRQKLGRKVFIYVDKNWTRKSWQIKARN